MQNMLMRACLTAALLTGCSRSDSWKVSHIQSGSKEFSSSRLSYRSPDPVNGVDVQFLSLDESCHLYLQVHSHPIKPYKGDPKKALVHVKTEDKTTTYLAIRRQGGQRLLLPDEAKDYIVEKLKSGQFVTISTSGYSSTLTPESFDKKYFLLEKPPRFRIPVHSPL